VGSSFSDVGFKICDQRNMKERMRPDGRIPQIVFDLFGPPQRRLYSFVPDRSERCHPLIVSAIGASRLPIGRDATLLSGSPVQH